MRAEGMPLRSQGPGVVGLVVDTPTFVLREDTFSRHSSRLVGTMREIIRRYVAFVIRNPTRVLVAAVVTSVLLSLAAMRVTVDLDPEKLLPADHPYILLDRAIRNEFGGKNLVAIAVLPQSGEIWKREVLEVVHDLTLDLLNARGVIRQTVVSLSSPNVRVPADRGGLLGAPLLMESVPQTDRAIASLRSAYEREALLNGMLSSAANRAAIGFADFYHAVSLAEI